MGHDRFWQVWQAPGGYTHVVEDWGDLGWRCKCRRWWPNKTWHRVNDDTPVTCGSCLRSRVNFKAAGLVRGW